MAKQPLQYKGLKVIDMRDARKGDPGYVAGRLQVVIKLKSGETKTVMRQEVTGSK